MKNPVVMEFLQTRRSTPAGVLSDPYPDKESIERILRAAARTPDHGKLVPWRFIILQKKVMQDLAKSVEEIGISKKLDPDKLQKNVRTFANAGLIIAVISSSKSSEKIPIIEQHLSAGAVCLALLNAAFADGWGANWLTGWMAYEKDFLQKVLRLSENEFVAGFIHIGTKKVKPVERARPVISELTWWYESG